MTIHDSHNNWAGDPAYMPVAVTCERCDGYGRLWHIGTVTTGRSEWRPCPDCNGGITTTRSADDLLAAFQTWRDGVEHTHEHFAPTPGKYVGHVPSQTFRDAEKVLLRYLPDLLRSRCSSPVEVES